MIGINEILIILVIILVLFFGSKRIEELGRALGRFMGEFKKGRLEAEKELRNLEERHEEKFDHKKT